LRKVVLTLLAHPDDAEILCGGTLVRLADSGWEIHIATMTAGDCGTMEKNAWEISAIRTAEARKAAAMIGGTYHCLDERDGFVVYDKPGLRKVVELFRAVNPSLVMTHAARDYMMDHEQASLLARSASFLFAAPNISTSPLPPSAAIPYLYYCDPIEGIDPLGAKVAATTLVDVSSVIDKKLAMLACHESQRAWLRAHHGMDEYLEATRRFAAERGKEAGVAAAEGFVQHRGHAYPADDLLAELDVTTRRSPVRKTAKTKISRK
jgi:LmbE family N-acetylglucosaminyl deacetylase